MSSPQKIILAIITDGRPDQTLQCCVSILQLQAALITTANAFQADLRFFKTINEAVTDLYKSKDFDGIFLIRYSAGVPGLFALKASQSKREVIIGTNPVGQYDWERVKTKITSTTEDVSHAGIVYNLMPSGNPDQFGYVKAKDVKVVDTMFMRRSALTHIVKNNPKVVSKDGQFSSIFIEGVFGGKHMTEVERFLSLYGKDVYTDVELQCSKSAPQDYVGIVGNRSQLR